MSPDICCDTCNTVLEARAIFHDDDANSLTITVNTHHVCKVPGRRAQRELAARDAEISRLLAALEIIAYRGEAAVAAYNSPRGLPTTFAGVRKVARKALDEQP
jgi:hypothetical protein